MKDLKRLSAILLALLLTFSLFGCETPPEDPDPSSIDWSALTDRPSAEPLTDPTTAPTTEPATDPTTSPTTIPPTKPATEPPTEPATERATEPTTGPATEPTTGAATEPPHQHTFCDATCTSPKTCTTCGKTKGSAKGHTYSGGYCEDCGTEDPDTSHETMVWIPTKGGKKYHTSADCSNMDDPDYVTLSEAEALGFTPCKRCYD